MIGEIVIFRNDKEQITWRIDIGTPPHQNVALISFWTYHTETSARSAARRWMNKLGLSPPPPPRKPLMRQVPLDAMAHDHGDGL